MNESEATNQQPTTEAAFMVVGLGASAGGVEALREFFSHVPPASGMAYIVILHLSPDRDSRLANVLQAVASIPITQVTERVVVEPNHGYLIPPDQHLLMVDGALVVASNPSFEERRVPVDIFFRVLAESYRTRAVCVVLSGTGANGSMGLKRVKERGGAAFVQNPREAAYQEMPRNAIATGLVDDILPVAAIPQRIIDYTIGLRTVSIPPDTIRQSDVAQQQALREVLSYVRRQTGHDFANYKRPTLFRRIERRIIVCGLPDLPSYAAFVREHPVEIQALLKDLLISVTNFFRDKTAFEALEQHILPRIMHTKGAEDVVRVWVVGCATGEEAYSIAMLLAERTLHVLDAPKVQIFATDIDDAALAHARDGVYSLNDAADVSPERLRQFFTAEGDYYRIRREIREMVLFANHNVLKDPPFSHLDLVTCRNVLIYLNETAQERAIETLHFALNPGGYLFLGTSESADKAGNLYAVVNREHHLFQSRQTGLRPYPLPETILSYRDEVPETQMPQRAQELLPLERISYAELHQRLLEHYAPPSIVVNTEYDIVHLSDRAGRYIQVGGGELSHNLLAMIRPELRLELRTALYQALQQRSNVEVQNLTLRIDQRNETINLLVRPVLAEHDTARGFVLIVFEPSTSPEDQAEPVIRADEPVAWHLEDELLRVKALLRLSNEQHEVQAEELKAANEELQAVNEELRSSTEELETSQEELQSINEELRTVNQELKANIEETTLANNNLQNLMYSTDIGTIFLDRSLRINLFTPAARALFHIIPQDRGRPLADITHRLRNVDVMADIQRVLAKLTPIEREVSTTDQQMFLMRVLPYRTADDRINGVVLTFIDLTERKRAEEALRESQERLQLTLQTTNTGTFLYHIREDRVDPDTRMLALFGLPPDGTFTFADALATLIYPDDRARCANAIARATDPTEDGVLHSDVRVTHPDGSLRWVSITAQTIFDGQPRRATLMYGVVVDITERKRAEEQHAFLLRLSDALRPLSDPVAVQEAAMQVLGEHLDVNRAFYSDVLDDEDTIAINPGYANGLSHIVGKIKFSAFDIDMMNAYRAGQTVVLHNIQTDVQFTAKAKAEFDTIHVQAACGVPLVKAGKVRAILSLHQSVPRIWTQAEIALLQETAERTWAAVERAKAEAALRESEAKYRTLFDTMEEGFCVIEMLYDAAGETIDYRFVEVNQVFEQQTGLKDAAGKIGSELTPGTERYWLTTYGRVARTGEPLRFENYHEATGRWYHVYASRVDGEGSRQVAIIFDDITERKRREIHQALLVEVADDLQRLTSPDEIINAVGRHLGEALNLNLCLLVDVDEDGDEVTVHHCWQRQSVPSLKQTFRIADYLTDAFARSQWAGEIFIVRDTVTDERTDAQACARLSVGSILSVPFHHTGRWLAHLTVTGPSPRDWRADEIEVVREIAERVFPRIERVRAEEALRESEQRLRVMIDNLPGGAVFIVDRHLRYLLAAGEALAPAGMTPEDLIGKALLEALPTELAREYESTYRGALAGETFEREHTAHGRTYISRGTPLYSANGDIYAVFVVSYDISDRKRAEQALQRAHDTLEQRVAERTAALAEANDERIALLQRLITAQEDERQHIARELHDGLGQFLTALMIRSTMLDAKAEHLPEIRRGLADLQAVARQIDAELDLLTLELRPPVLNDLGLEDALHEYVQQWTDTSDVPVDILVRGMGQSRLPPLLETAIYRITQEALNNTLKHAQATTVSIVMERRADHVRVVIEDDGTGFDQEEVRHERRGGRQVGLVGMAERAALVGGMLSIDSEPGSGTTLYLTIPLPKESS